MAIRRISQLTHGLCTIYVSLISRFAFLPALKRTTSIIMRVCVSHRRETTSEMTSLYTAHAMHPQPLVQPVPTELWYNFVYCQPVYDHEVGEVCGETTGWGANQHKRLLRNVFVVTLPLTLTRERSMTYHCLRSHETAASDKIGVF